MLVQKVEIETRMMPANEGRLSSLLPWLRSYRWSRAWPLLASVLLHLTVLGAYLVSWTPAPPPPLLQIELLPPAPVPPMPLEAAPSPTQAPVKPLPVFPTLAPRPLPHLPLRPIATTSGRAEHSIPKLPPKPPEKALRDAVLDAESQKTRLLKAADAAALPVSGAKKGDDMVIGEPSPNSRPAGPPPDYLGLIRAQLERVKRYPAQARSAGQEGTVMLAFILERSGELASWRIVGPSDVPALDEEAAAMIRRASFPPFPADFAGNDIHLVVPVEFSLKDPDKQ